MKYPVFVPSITSDDINLVSRSLSEGWVSSTGPFVRSFEQGISDYLNCKYSTTVSNGTAALEVALASLGVNSGEVILPAFTIASCAYAVKRVGATPVFVDIDTDYFCIDPHKVEQAITSDTKAIMIVNMYGNTCDVDAFIRIRNEFSLPIVEDCSENLGGSYEGNMCGSQFDVATFSLYANKTITSGEGGLVCTSNSDTYSKALRYKNLDFPSDRSFTHDSDAFNYRMASPLAALALSQLSRIDDILSSKDRIYNSYLKHINLSLLSPLKQRPNTRFIPWMNCFLVAESIPFDYKHFECFMSEHSIQVRPFFSNLSEQSSFSNSYSSLSLPITNSICDRGFYLPSSTLLTDSDIQYISNICNSYFSK